MQLNNQLTDVLALHDAILYGTRKTLTGLLLVSVVTSTVEQTIPGLEGVVDRLEILLAHD